MGGYNPFRFDRSCNTPSATNGSYFWWEKPGKQAMKNKTKAAGKRKTAAVPVATLFQWAGVLKDFREACFHSISKATGMTMEEVAKQEKEMWKSVP